MNNEDIVRKTELLDFNIIKLLNQRMELSLRRMKMGEEESPVRPLKAGDYFEELIKGDFQKALFSAIQNETDRILQNPPIMAGFQGEHGAFGEVACRRLKGNVAPIPCLEFTDVFDGVEKGWLDLGIVPIENSLQGAVTHVNDLLVERDLFITGEIYVNVSHCLLTLPDTDYREIKVVYSHPQALGQCRGFIFRNRLEARPFYDTAGAAAMISRERPNGAAAIAGSLCGGLYNLQVIKEGIEDHKSNFTRFVVLSKKCPTGGGVKCSVVFTAPHRVGTLFDVLRLFADASINLTRIESRPVRNDPGDYAFLLDFMGSGDDEKVTEVLDKVKEKTTSCKFLGCYREGIS